MPVESSPTPAGDPTLSPGTRLQDLIVERWLCAVPDGHHYRVVHAATGRGATLHEYLPRAWAHREGSTVRALPGHEQDFELGLRRFTAKARRLKGLAHPALPLLLDVWSSHGTACALMSPLPAQTLAQVVAAQGGRLRLAQAWPWIRACFELADWLHEKDLIHGAWDPDAIWVQEDQRLLMAAPEGDGGVRPPSPWVALEQSHPSPSGVRCGPWTDVFGIAAIAAFMLTGQSPSTARRLPLSAWIPPAPAGAAAAGAVRRSAGEPPPRALLAAIRVSLLPNPRQRPQDIQQLKAMMGLGGQPAAPGERELASLPPDMPQTEFGEETLPLLDASATAPADRPGSPPTAPAPLVVAAGRRQAAAPPPTPVAKTPAARNPFVAVLVGTVLAVAGVTWVMVTRPDAAAPVAGSSGPAGGDPIERLVSSSPPAAGVNAAAPAAPAAVAPVVPVVPAVAAASAAAAGAARPSPAPASAARPPPPLATAAAASAHVSVKASPAAAAAAMPGGAPRPANLSPTAAAPAGAGASAVAAGSAARAAAATVSAPTPVPARVPATTARPAATPSAVPAADPPLPLSRCSKSLLQQSLGGGAATDAKECP